MDRRRSALGDVSNLESPHRRETSRHHAPPVPHRRHREDLRYFACYRLPGVRATRWRLSLAHVEQLGARDSQILRQPGARFGRAVLHCAPRKSARPPSPAGGRMSPPAAMRRLADLRDQLALFARRRRPLFRLRGPEGCVSWERRGADSTCPGGERVIVTSAAVRSLSGGCRAAAARRRSGRPHEAGERCGACLTIAGRQLPQPPAGGHERCRDSELGGTIVLGAT